MPVIRVEMFKGRTRDQKRALIKELTDGFLRDLRRQARERAVVIVDVEKEDWGIGGELMADKYPDK